MKVINNPCFIDIGRGSSLASLADIAHKRMYWLAAKEPPCVQESISSGGPSALRANRRKAGRIGPA